MISPLTTAQAIAKLIEPEAPPLTALAMLSTESRVLTGLVHHDFAMRTAVAVAAGLCDRPITDEQVVTGLARLQKQAAKSGGKMARLATAVQQAIALRTSAKVASVLRAAAWALLRTGE